MKILGRMWRIYHVSAIFFRTPCQRSSIAGQWNRGIMQSIRRLSLLRIYGDHSRTGCIRAAHIPRMHDAVGVCIAPLPRTFCVWFARRSHGDFLSMFKILWCTFGETTAHTKFLGACGVSTVYLHFFPHAICQRSRIASQWDRSIE